MLNQLGQDASTRNSTNVRLIVEQACIIKKPTNAQVKACVPQNSG
jgi:hypothetical protein